ncbi:MFS transporter [Halalkalibacter sp. APA_J-10(15)]|uniref:MFS transporter n=1 Tax=Halalkalibacter sp. APA_J-10(15) TaxID=2933805 RepID=UPI001FF25143|nr:MFS transporter [Halalkalibacter sp. APA_J-10(15)]MCK0471177.1 MFS transporter [Halalkalibacter sp. APA_J-10(15)]
MNNSGNNQSNTEKNSAIATDVPLRAGKREWIGLAVLALPTLLLSLDLSVLFLAAPHLAADLQPTAAQLLWIMDIYGFMIAGFLITMGTLGDRIGRRKLLLIGAGVFSIASVAAAYSINPEMLIVTRALLGIAGATLMPSTLALISNMFRNPQQRAVAVSVWMTCFLSGVAIGPVVGGVLLEYFWWGSVFLLGVPVMLLLLVTGPILLPEYRDPKAGRLDLASVALSLVAILPIIYGIKELAKDGLEILPVLSMVAGLVFSVLFGLRQRRLTNPLLDLRLFAYRSFSIALGTMLFVLITVGGNTMFFAQYLQMVEGLSSWLAGLWMVPSAAAMIIGSLLSPLIARRIPPGYIVGLGLMISAGGFLLLTQVDQTSGVSLLIIGFVIAFFGVSPTMVLGTDLVIGSVPPKKAGSASAISQTCMEFGMALGIAVLGSVGTAVYRNQMSDSIPTGVPVEAAEAIRDNLGSAIAVAEQLPSGLSMELLETAREAFTIGFNTSVSISAVIGIVAALFAVVLLRHVRPSGEAHIEPDKHSSSLAEGERS